MKKILSILIGIIFLSGCVDKSTQGKKLLKCDYGTTGIVNVVNKETNHEVNEQVSFDLKSIYYAKDDFIYRKEFILTINRKENGSILKLFNNNTDAFYNQLYAPFFPHDESNVLKNTEIDKNTITFYSEANFIKKEGILHQINPYNELSLSALFEEGGPYNDKEACTLTE